VIHDRDRVGHRHRLLLVVRDVDERDPDVVLQPLEEQLHLLAELEVERAQRLVEEEHARLAHQRSRESDPLLLAAGDLPRLALAEAAQSDEVEHLLHPRSDHLPRLALAAQAEGDVLEQGQVGEERVALEDRVHVPFVRRQARDGPVAEVDRPGTRLLEAADHPQRRRLPAARGPEQREEAALLDLEREVVDRRDAVEALRQALEPHIDDRRRGIHGSVGGAQLLGHPVSPARSGGAPIRAPQS
jgi:hypothetical protein